MAGSELVDYDRVADLYKVGRAMPDEVLDRWGRAVRPHLPVDGRVRVADVGAGTGIFATVWPSWGASGVVAVEVSAAMAAHGRGVAPYVRGVAEALPLAAGSVEVVWLSTAFHHFADKAAAVAEIDRVVAPGGVVLIRTFLAERARQSYFRLYPGIEKALRLCPDVAWFAEWFGPAGFMVRQVEDLRDVETTYAEAPTGWSGCATPIPCSPPSPMTRSPPACAACVTRRMRQRCSTSASWSCAGKPVG